MVPIAGHQHRTAPGPPIRLEKSRQAIGACAEGHTMARGGRADASLWHRGYSDRNNEWARLRRGEPRMPSPCSLR